MLPTTPAVDGIGKLYISGNVLPNEWFKCPRLRYESGAVNLLAIVILSEIVYWYKPSEVRDEHTGNTIGWKKKFAADKLQRSYEELSTKFGCSKRQAAEACYFLRDVGLITLELRTIKVNGGSLTLSNVLFIEPVVGAIEAICQTTTLVELDPPHTLERNTLIHPNVIPPTLKRNTYTKTSTKTSTENVIVAEATEEKMKATDILNKHASVQKSKLASVSVDGKKPLPLPVLWKHRVSALFGGYQKALTNKEIGQLGILNKKLGKDVHEVVDFALKNWVKFGAKAQNGAGLTNYPSDPNIGFLLLYYQYAVNMMQSIAQEVVQEKAIELPKVTKSASVVFDKKNLLGEEDYEPYKPPKEELAKLIEGPK